MKEIYIKTQAELDKLTHIEADEAVYIETNETLTLKANINIFGFIKIAAKIIYNASAVLRENAGAELWGNARAVLRENASAVLRENAGAVLWENASAVLRENASAVLRENAGAVLRENAGAELWGNARAALWGNARAVLRENASAVLWGNARAELWGNARAELWENARAELRGNAVSWCLSANVKIDLFGFSVAFCPLDIKAKITRKQKTAVIQRTKIEKNFHKREAVTGKAGGILYKRVSKDYLTQEGMPNETKWTVGTTVVCSKWNPKGAECGDGKFHACSRPYFCDEFRSEKPDDRYVAILVKKADTYTWPDPQYPHKIGFRQGTVLHECDWMGEKR